MVKLKKKIEVYENLLHNIYFASSVAMNGEIVKKYLDNIARWSYAHRQGNGELSIKEQKKLVESAFNNLLKINEN